MPEGGCQCGAIRYEVKGEAGHRALCHCSDCRKSAGATPVGWALFAQDQVTIRGAAARYQSSEQAVRHFCPTCGTTLFFTSEAVFPGMIDITIGSLDDPDSYAPTAHIQTADAPQWDAHLAEWPRFPRYPGA